MRPRQAPYALDGRVERVHTGCAVVGEAPDAPPIGDGEALDLIDTTADVLPVKDDQPTMHQDVAASSADALDEKPRPRDQPRPLSIETFEETTMGHGRIEARVIHVCRDLSRLTPADRWHGLSFIATVVRTRADPSSGDASHVRACSIGSAERASAERIIERDRPAAPRSSVDTGAPLRQEPWRSRGLDPAGWPPRPHRLEA